jgi:hypothetical protein
MLFVLLVHPNCLLSLLSYKILNFYKYSNDIKKKTVITEQGIWYTQNDNFLKDAPNFSFKVHSPVPKTNGLTQYSPFLLTHATGMIKSTQCILLLFVLRHSDRNGDEKSPVSAKNIRYFLIIP